MDVFFWKFTTLRGIMGSSSPAGMERSREGEINISEHRRDHRNLAGLARLRQKQVGERKSRAAGGKFGVCRGCSLRFSLKWTVLCAAISHNSWTCLLMSLSSSGLPVFVDSLNERRFPTLKFIIMKALMLMAMEKQRAGLGLKQSTSWKYGLDSCLRWGFFF